ncbi:MAG: D-alanine--D-alanine ligase, partial [bacterium]
MRVAVLMGGTSAERDVSLASGRWVARGLRAAGYEVSAIDTALGGQQPGENPERLGEGIRRQPPKPDRFSPAGDRSAFEAVQLGASLNPEAVFIALHGGPGEDGTVQGMLELAGLPYTGSGVLASALAMDKAVSKTIFKEKGVLTPPWFQIRADDGAGGPAISRKVEETFGFPVVVKPNDQGSTVGLSIVERPQELGRAIKRAAAYSREVLVEQYVPGREVTASILGDEPLPLIEIHPEHGVYDYECKYTKGKSRYTVPAQLPDEITARSKEMGMKAFEALKCAGFGRV